MRRPLAPIIAPAVVGLATAGLVTWKAVRAHAGPRGVLVLAGDSYAAGLGLAITGDANLPSGPGLDFMANGIPGSGTRQWVEVVGISLKNRSRRFVIFSLGTNDTGAPIQQLRGDIAQIAADCKKYKTGLGWIRPPRAVLAKLPAAALCWREWRRVVGEGRTFDTDSHVKVELGPDGLHPLNYRPWAEALWSWLALLTA